MKNKSGVLCDGIIKKASSLEICYKDLTNISGMQKFKHQGYNFCSDCMNNFKYDTKHNKIIFRLLHLNTISDYYDEYDFEDKYQLLKLRSKWHSYKT